MKTLVKSILMVDDEIPEDLDHPGNPTPYMWYYAKRLKQDQRFCVDLARTVEEAKLALEKADYNIVTMDVIMLAEGGDLESSKNGTRTGLALLEWMIEQKKKSAVLILSLLPEEKLLRELPRNLGQLSTIIVLEKMNTTPSSLLERLSNMRIH